jgi:glycerophosphoryl diester phosphodiesterase
LLSSLDRWLAPAPDPARIAWLKGVLYAHRGLHGPQAIENSPSAFAAAIDAGLGIECDVRESADRRDVVFHDQELDRLSGKKGAGAGRTAANLARIALRGSRDTIPSLRDVLKQVASRVPLLIEIKTVREREVAALCRTVQRDLARYRGPCAVMSFDPRAGGWFRRNAPATVRGLVISESDGGEGRRRRALWQVRPDFLAYAIHDLPSRFAAAQRARGVPVLTWTVSSEALLERARMQADGFIAEAAGLASALANP